MQWVGRFFLGGMVVSLFALVGDVLRPKGFAGLFGAAPSVAIATLLLTLHFEGKEYAALEGRSMIVGAGAFLVYALACVQLIARKDLKTGRTAIAMLGVWLVCAFGG